MAGIIAVLVGIVGLLFIVAYMMKITINRNF